MDTEDLIPFQAELDDLLDQWDFKRKLILWFYYRKSMSQTDISKELGVSTFVVSKWINRWKAQGNINEEEGRGKKVLYTPKEEEMVVEKQKSDRFKTAASIQREMLKEGHGLSYKQVLYLAFNIVTYN